MSLPAQIPAQRRSADTALAGLREFGLIVKYDQADGLPEAMRPTILLMLQDRARDTLRLAGIPFLQSTDEADMAGRPRLVFMVTANNQTASSPAIHVDSRLYERVRLWRDPAKQTELATWFSSGVGGSKATNKMLFDVFDGQLDSFVEAYRAANLNPTNAESRTPDPRAQLTDNANPLQGLNGVRLFIALRPSDPLADTDRSAELRKMLQSEAEIKLKQAGIAVLRYTKESDKAGRALLYVMITLREVKFGAPAIVVESDVTQRVRPIRDPQRDLYPITWESRASDNHQITDEAVLRVVKSQLDEFIKAHTAANAQQPSAPK